MWFFTLLAMADPGASYLGRPIAPTMHASGAPWLTRATRDGEEQPRKLLGALELKKGQIACDVGAGNGFYTLKLAREVGRKGQVYATDIQADMLELLRRRATVAGIDNITRVLSTQDDAKLPPGRCDLILLVDVYHELADPGAMLAQLRKALAPDGRVALVEYRAEDPDVPIKPLHKMSVEQCDREWTANGFERVGRYDGLPWQHVLFYASATEAPPAQ